MPEMTEQQVDELADIMIARGYGPWLKVTTKEQQAQALAEFAEKDLFNFGGPGGVREAARLVEAVCTKEGIDLDVEIDTP